MKLYIDKLANWFCDKYLSDTINRKVVLAVSNCMGDFHEYFQEYVKELNAFTASDVHYRGEGFIVMAAKVKGTDFVKVIPMRPFKSMAEYKDMCDFLTARYGARHYHFDSPSRGRIEREMINHFRG